MASAAAAARQRQRIDELCEAALRAQSGVCDLRLRGGRVWRGGALLQRFGPHLEPSLEAGDDFASFRGAADGLAARLAHCDLELHRRLLPADQLERWVFELLEQLRCEAAVELSGVRANLRHRFEAWSLELQRSGLAESERGLLLYTLAQVVRSRVGSEPVVAASEDLIEATRAAIVPLIGPALAGLRRERADQAAYAAHALAIADVIRRSLPDQPADGAAARRDPNRPLAARFNLWLDFDAEVDDGIASLATGGVRTGADRTAPYRTFTTAYDRELRAGALVRRALLDEYRERIDAGMAGQGINVARLARELSARIALPVRDGWDDGQEDGVIDARRLAQLVASPAERRLFRHERIAPLADCAVALLVDCSGSMRAHAEPVARLVDAFARAFEIAGASCEVLGFTTGAWNGGRSARAWQRAGRPREPGRLAERCHLVFKDADTPWRRARRDIAALLKGDLFREGLDGEAVAWASERLLARDAQRRLLWVLSDGSPMDGATALANDDGYLERHLREVVARIDAARQVEIGAIGVALDLRDHYPNSCAIDPAAGIGNGTLSGIANALLRRRPPGR